ncbi:hypothetical protein [Microterricola gilva]|uniref:hypothetical protein n=1 Tax=Microterricola gilva TaxID=393267 RepID=UPI00102AE272|nr:hypothetical protein [Microterricola gilva]
MSTTIDVDASIDSTVEFWQRVGAPDGASPQPVSAQATQWTVLVNGVPSTRGAAAAAAELSRMTDLSNVVGAAPRGEVTFESLGEQRTRIAISVEWQREDTAESYVPLILLDGVHVNTDLRDFKRQVEREVRGSREWRATVERFEAL